MDWKNSYNNSCNCKIKTKYPLENNNNNIDNIVYQANISTKENDTNDKAYIGMTCLNWKFRYYNHLQSFRKPTLKNQTVLFRYYWGLIELGLTTIINWKIIKRSSMTKS